MKCRCYLAWLLAVAANAQVSIELKPTEPATLPIIVDSNSPTFWRNGRLHLFSSAGTPLLHTLDGQMNVTASREVKVNSQDHFPMWIESVWENGNGKLYAWYHYEQTNVCNGLSVPQIGALVSRDGGQSFTDLGIIINSGDAIDCDAQNGYFAGGHGDFSVIVDPQGEYVYFLFGSYGGDVSQQGIATARMSIAALNNPVGAAWKYHDGAWQEPGLGGKVTPTFPAAVAWQQPDSDALWGPSVHYNTYLESYVMVMNRACCSPDWPQEGIYLSMSRDISDPLSWTAPVKIIDGGDWYPWVLGDGQTTRFFLRDTSEWELTFDSGLEDECQPAAQRAR